MRPVFLWTVVLLSCTVGVGFFGRDSARARSEWHAASASLQSVTESARSLAALQSVQPASWTSHVTASNKDSLAERVGGALAAAGLPASAMTSLSPEAETSLASDQSTKALRRRATVTLSSITLPQLGGFLDAWRTQEPEWTVISIDLAPQPNSGAGTAATGGDMPLRAVLVLESMYAERVVSLRPGGGTK